MRDVAEADSTDRSPGLIARSAQGLLVGLLLVTVALALNLPWPLEPKARAALPYLALAFVHWHAFRIPQALPAPVALVAGLVADLIADTPLGFWPLIYLSVLASGRGMRQLPGDAAGLARALPAVAVYALVAVAVALLATYLYTLVWPAPAPILAGVGLACGMELLAVLVASSLQRRPQALPAIATGGER